MERDQRRRRSSQAVARRKDEDLERLEREAQECLTAIVVPPYVPPTEEELARRDSVVRRIAEFRERRGVVPFSVTELIREDREAR
ncbi:MAG: hypothetical protein NTZ05_08010 [Chloroflexi bacterium]|nr:hypothetical protein [Chloroflexota bacterium]